MQLKMRPILRVLGAHAWKFHRNNVTGSAYIHNHRFVKGISLASGIKYPRYVIGNTRDVSTGMEKTGPGTIFRSPVPDVELPVQSISDFLFSRFNTFGNTIALVDHGTGRSFQFSQLEDLSRRVGSFLARKGLRKGDVVCYYGTNNPEFALLLLGCSSIGVTLTTASPLYTPDELKSQMEIAGCKTIFTIPPLARKCQEAGFNDLVLVGGSEGGRPFSDALSDDGRAFPSHVRVDPKEDVAILPFSSGTTGLPKGVMLTHHNIVSNLLQFSVNLKTYANDVNIAVLPFFHIYGLASILLCSLMEGAKLVILPGFDPQIYLTALVQHKVTQIHIVPPIILFMARHPLVDKVDLSLIRTVVSAAAPLGDALTIEFMEKRKLPIKQGYGLTETSPVIAVDVDPITVGSVGPLIPNTEAKIIDPDTGESLGHNEVGEVCIRGPQNMKGYHGNPQATNEMVDTEGWLHTGDMGYFKETDRLVISDRMKELIKYKGLQVAPAELEDLLHKHPAVQDVAVVAAADERAGEVPQAFVVIRPNMAAKEEDIRKFVDDQVADHKQLRGGVKFLKEIPKSASGKILRRVLKDMK
ncbi:uncharacterized protein LOC127875253 [Dreissena polymorpha]|uniref:uncharacterized protein LOC127875253 n=1 Tax=Dreissena polymorpha TaxID=45954 RepID=UPI0022652EBA|nr:uncharacterized protein LOC127875253 [Dreissena polymorpha]